MCYGIYYLCRRNVSDNKGWKGEMKVHDFKVYILFEQVEYYLKS